MFRLRVCQPFNEMLAYGHRNAGVMLAISLSYLGAIVLLAQPLSVGAESLPEHQDAGGVVVGNTSERKLWNVLWKWPWVEGGEDLRKKGLLEKFAERLTFGLQTQKRAAIEQKNGKEEKAETTSAIPEGFQDLKL